MSDHNGILIEFNSALNLLSVVIQTFSIFGTSPDFQTSNYLLHQDGYNEEKKLDSTLPAKDSKVFHAMLIADKFVGSFMQ